MTLQHLLQPHIFKAIQENFNVQLDKIEFQATRKDFEGDCTMVLFPLLKIIKSNPTELGNVIGNYLEKNTNLVAKFNVVSGFLNLVITDSFYYNQFKEMYSNDTFGFVTSSSNGKAVMVEFASPNTNKPLHLGHIRNILLGYSVSNILKASGQKVYNTQIINDRGIHICKSMLAWQKFGNGETPTSSGLKGDHFVGKYYVAFDKQYKQEIEELKQQGKNEDDAKKSAPIIVEAQEMLRKWENGDEQVVALWQKMNQWVYDGFEVTYKNLGVDFDKYYYESQTYLLGKEVINFGLEKGVFYKKPDGSVWIDLTDDGLDEKLVLRSDGTSVYITQDIGTAIQRVKDFPDVGGMVYTVGNEQDYHFKVLFLILKKLGFDWAQNLYHLSYGMVELPSGKMKSREGTVVDADDLLQEMTHTAQEISQELGKLDGYSETEKQKLYEIIGAGALKYFMLKVDPKKQMLFNPAESVDFNGNTGPFIQYTYARIQSILRKADFDYSTTSSSTEVETVISSGVETVISSGVETVISSEVETVISSEVEIHPKEKELIKQLELFPEVIQDAAKNHSPALVANYTYDLVKEYNSFYQSVSILGEENHDKKVFRVQLSAKVGKVIKDAFQLLGIEVPDRM